MSTIYANFLAGVVDDNPLGSINTSINSSAFANLPIVTAPDIMWMTLDPDAVNGQPEIVQIIDHAASATTVTVVRAQQNTLQRVHPQNTVWRVAVTKQDFNEFLKDVGTADIVDDAVTQPKIGPLAVGTTELADSAVTSAKIADGTIATGDLANDAVDNTKLANMAQSTIKGRASGAGTGDPTDLSAAQVLAILQAGGNAQVSSGTYTPTMTGWAVGAGSNSASWVFVGGPNTGDKGILRVDGRIVMGSGFTAPASNAKISIPAGFSVSVTGGKPVGQGYAYLQSATRFITLAITNTATVLFSYLDNSNPVVVYTMGNGAPFNVNDVVEYSFELIVTRS